MKLFAILSAFIVGFVVQATPLSHEARSGMAVLTKTAFSTSQKDVLSGIHAAAISLVPGSRLEKCQINPILVFCSGVGCTGNCYTFTIIGIEEGVCLAPLPNPFFSLFINDPSGEGLTFVIGAAANTDCANLVTIPDTNKCFNISPFGESWAVLP